MSVDRIREFDRDLDEGQADEQAKDREQELEFGHGAPHHQLWQAAAEFGSGKRWKPTTRREIVVAASFRT
jgi:hypothetical protein